MIHQMRLSVVVVAPGTFPIEGVGPEKKKKQELCLHVLAFFFVSVSPLDLNLVQFLELSGGF